MQDSTFLFDINSEDIDTSKLVSQLKLLSSIFELKDNDTIVLNAIIKKLREKVEAPLKVKPQMPKVSASFLL